MKLLEHILGDPRKYFHEFRQGDAQDQIQNPPPEDIENIDLTELDQDQEQLQQDSEPQQDEAPDEVEFNPEDNAEDIVTEADSESSEMTHGGSESTQSIENSPNPGGDAANNMDNSDKNSDEANDTANPADTDHTNDEDGDRTDNTDSDEANDTDGDTLDSEDSDYSNDEEDDADYDEDGDEEADDEEDMSNDGAGKDASGTRKMSHHEIESQIRYVQEADAVIKFIKFVARKRLGTQHEDGAERWDAAKIAKLHLKRMYHRIPKAKYSQKQTKDVVLIVDTSGSMASVDHIITALLQLLKEYDFRIRVIPAANGFFGAVDAEYAEEDEAYFNQFGIQPEYLDYPEIVKLVKASPLSFIIADFDGWSSFCTLANDTKGNEPIMLCTESRYEHPLDHNWVDYDNWYYPGYIVYIDGRTYADLMADWNKGPGWLK